MEERRSLVLQRDEARDKAERLEINTRRLQEDLKLALNEGYRHTAEILRLKTEQAQRQRSWRRS